MNMYLAQLSVSFSVFTHVHVHNVHVHIGSSSFVVTTAEGRNFEIIRARTSKKNNVNFTAVKAMYMYVPCLYMYMYE